MALALCLPNAGIKGLCSYTWPSFFLVLFVFLSLYFLFLFLKQSPSVGQAGLQAGLHGYVAEDDLELIFFPVPFK